MPEGNLQSWGLANPQGMLTNAGLLLADESPFYSSRIFCTRWCGLAKGGGLADAYDHQEFSGSLIWQLRSAEAFIGFFCHTVWKKTDNSRLEFPDYAQESYREALVNAVVHRDYLERGSEIHVDIFDDRMEIYSPGGMEDGQDVQDRDPRTIAPRRRNPVLADVFEKLGYMEGAGGGFRTILDGYEHALAFNKGKEPKFYSNRSTFIAMLPNLNYKNDRLEELVGPGFTCERLRQVSAIRAPCALEGAGAREAANAGASETALLEAMELGVAISADDLAGRLGLGQARTLEILERLVERRQVIATVAARGLVYVKVKGLSDEG